MTYDNFPMDVNNLIESKELKQFCRKHHIRQLAFFGSVLRDDFTPQSDIDVLVKFEPEFTPALVEMTDSPNLSFSSATRNLRSN